MMIISVESKILKANYFEYNLKAETKDHCKIIDETIAEFNPNKTTIAII